MFGYQFDLSDFVALCALFVSAISMGWTVFVYKVIARVNSLRFNISNMVHVENVVGELPQVLRFHGVTDYQKALDDCEVTSEELAYLINSFTLAGNYYRTAPDRDRIFEHGSYRMRMVSSPPTRKAWPLVRIMIADSEFRDRLDKMMDA